MKANKIASAIATLPRFVELNGFLWECNLIPRHKQSERLVRVEQAMVTMRQKFRVTYEKGKFFSPKKKEIMIPTVMNKHGDFFRVDDLVAALEGAL